MGKGNYCFTVCLEDTVEILGYKKTFEKQGKKKVSFSVQNSSGSVCVCHSSWPVRDVLSTCINILVFHLVSTRANLAYSPPLLCNSHQKSDFCHYPFALYFFNYSATSWQVNTYCCRAGWCKHVEKGLGPG